MPYGYADSERGVVAMSYTRLTPDAGATAIGTGATAETGNNKSHKIRVKLHGTGAISVTFEPRWCPDDATPGAGDLISSAQTLSGTNSVSQTYTFTGPGGFVSCPITAISGTGATVEILYSGVN